MKKNTYRIEKVKQGRKDLNNPGLGNNHKNKVLCIVAHPDDEALGVGGTLIKHCQCSDDVFIIILSEGEESKSDISTRNPKRLQNAINWSKETGCNLHKVYKFPDQKLDSVPELELVTLLEKHIKSIKPDIVYTHFPSDLNKDHRVISAATFAAIRPISSHKINPEIRTFETPSSSDQAPQVFPYVFTLP